jgi:hypothetical protein
MTSAAPTLEQLVLNNKCVSIPGILSIHANERSRKYAETYIAPHKVGQFMNGEATFPSVLISMTPSPTAFEENIVANINSFVLRSQGRAREPWLVFS